MKPRAPAELTRIEAASQTPQGLALALVTLALAMGGAPRLHIAEQAGPIADDLLDGLAKINAHCPETDFR